MDSQQSQQAQQSQQQKQATEVRNQLIQKTNAAKTALNDLMHVNAAYIQELEGLQNNSSTRSEQTTRQLQAAQAFDQQIVTLLDQLEKALITLDQAFS